MVVVRVAASPEEADEIVLLLARHGVASTTRSEFHASTLEPLDRRTVLVASEEHAALAGRVLAGQSEPVPAPRRYTERLLDRRGVASTRIRWVLAALILC